MKGANRKLGKHASITSEQINLLVEELRALIQKEHDPLPDEPEYITSDKTLRRFLLAKKYILKDAHEQLSKSIEWRRQYRPKSVQCKWCTENPGFHGIRQIGFDKEGRSVFYGCFAQCQTLTNTAEDVIAHVVYLVENAIKCPEAAVDQIVIIIDCTGLTLPCCNPKLGKNFASVFGTNYPEYLSRFYLINHNPIFQGVWKAIKVFVDPVSVNKVRLVRKKKWADTFNEDLGPEITKWILEESELNRTNISEAQLRFWEEPKSQTHDPRGIASYVREYIETLSGMRQKENRTLLDDSSLGPFCHYPHPNILDHINGKLNNVTIRNPKSKVLYKPTEKEMLDYGIDPTIEDENNSDNES